MLHGLASPRFHYTDTPSKGFDEERAYDVVLANPPFKGAIDAADVNSSLPAKCKLACWQHRHDAKFQKQRDARLAELQKQIAPLKRGRLDHHAIIHRLKFEEVIAGSSRRKEAETSSDAKLSRAKKNKSLLTSAATDDEARAAREKAEAELAELQSRIAPLEKEINQLTRQFWVTKETYLGFRRILTWRFPYKLF